MSDYSIIDDFKNFFYDLSHYSSSCTTGGFFEVSIDFTQSRYFDDHEQLDDLVRFAIGQAKAGCQVFFGPAARKKDLGSSRSSVANVLCTKSLWVDIDSPDKELPADQRLAEAKKLLDDFKQQLGKYGIQPSYIVVSGNGYHVYFLLKKFSLHPNSDWQNAQNALVRLAKGDPQVRQPGSLLRVPGSFNYKDPSNPKPVNIIEKSDTKYDIGDFSLLVMDMAKKYQERQKVVPTSIGEGKLGFAPPCVAGLLDPSNKPPLGHRHQVRQVLGIYAFHEGWDLKDTIQKVMHTTDDPKKAERDIEGIYKVLERDPERYSVGCNGETLLRALIDAGIAVCDEKSCRFKQPKAVKDSDKKEVVSAFFKGLVDIVVDDTGKMVYLIKDGDALVVTDRYETAACIYVPPPEHAVIWKAPRSSEVIKYYAADNDAQLFKDLVEYHRKISELPDENYYLFLAAWDMHTHLIEMMEYSPIIWFYAIPARGKSRTAKGMTFVSRRGVIQTTIKEAHIIRLATDHRATLFYDIMDLWKKLERSGAEDLLLNRFEPGAKIPRVQDPDKGAFIDTRWYDIYGPTIIATNKEINEILETRSIQIVMPEATKIFENDVKEAGALPLRERLTAFRARWMDRKLPAASKPVTGRLGDILKPIWQIAKIACADDSWFTEFATDEKERKMKDGQDTDDAKVVNAIVQMLDKVEGGHLLHKYPIEVINAGVADQFKMKPQRLGRITRRLGFEKYSDGNNRGIIIKEDLLKRLCHRYGIRIDDGVLTV